MAKKTIDKTYEEKLAALDREVEEKKAKIKKEWEIEISEDPEFAAKEIATLLHEKMCNSDHVEQCDWTYDIGDWSQHSRKEYLKMAKKLLKKVDYFSIVEVLKLFRNVNR